MDTQPELLSYLRGKLLQPRVCREPQSDPGISIDGARIVVMLDDRGADDEIKHFLILQDATGRSDIDDRVHFA